MATLRVETRIRAPAARCFDLARDVETHVATTGRTGERVVAGVASGLLQLGDEVTFEARHLGFRQRLTARITELDRPRRFVDVMVRGAFARLRHEHLFQENVGTTTMIDVVEFVSPLGSLGRVFDAVFLRRYMERFVRDRAEALKRLAESR